MRVSQEYNTNNSTTTNLAAKSSTNKGVGLPILITSKSTGQSIVNPIYPALQVDVNFFDKNPHEIKQQQPYE